MSNPTTDIKVPFREFGRPNPQDEISIEVTDIGDRLHMVTTQTRNSKVLKHTNAYLSFDDVARLHLVTKNWLRKNAQ